MSTTVTLNVFSGRPNPTFQLDDKQSDELAERLKGLQSFTEQRPSGAFGGLGYRGFSVSRSHTHPEGALDLRVHEGIVEQGLHAANLTDEAELEHWLAQLAQPHLTPEVAEHLSQVLQPANRLRFPFPPLKLACPANHAHDAPAYNPGLWNVPSVQPPSGPACATSSRRCPGDTSGSRCSARSPGRRTSPGRRPGAPRSWAWRAGRPTWRPPGR